MRYLLRNMRVPAGLRLLLFALLGAAAWVSVLPLIPSVHRDVGPATVAARAGLGAGSTSFVAPPLGTVSADTHAAPLNVQVLLSEIDVSELERTMREDDLLSGLAVSVEQDLRTLARGLAVQQMIAGALAGVLVAALLPRRHLVNFVVAPAGGVLAAAVAISITTLTFDERAFEQPRFTGALRRAPQVIEAANRGIESFEVLGSRYEALAQSLSRLLALAADPGLDVQEGAVTILHVSDVHSNPLGVEFIRRLARAFDVDAVVDTGDLTSFGERIESRLGKLVAGMPAPYLFVPGNHDSASNRLAIDALPNATLLDGRTEDVAGVDILGWADPTFTARNEISAEEGNQIRLDTAADVLGAVLELRPDILAVHDTRLASESFGHVEVVLAGHTHKRAVEEVSGTLVLVVGSAGATGLGSFVVETDIPYEAEVLYLRPDAPIIVDYVSLSGIADEFDVERRVIEVEARSN